MIVFSYSRDDLERPQPMTLRRIIAREPREHVHDLEVALDLRAHARPQDLDDDFVAVRATSPCAPARSTLPRAASVEALEHLARRADRTRARRSRELPRRGTAARGPAASRAHRRCRPAAGRGRVDSAWPNFTKIGPSSSSASRSRSPRGPPFCARTRSPATGRTRKRSGRNRCVARMISSRPWRTSTRWIVEQAARADAERSTGVTRRSRRRGVEPREPRFEPLDGVAQPIDVVNRTPRLERRAGTSRPSSCRYSAVFLRERRGRAPQASAPARAAADLVRGTSPTSARAPPRGRAAPAAAGRETLCATSASPESRRRRCSRASAARATSESSASGVARELGVASTRSVRTSRICARRRRASARSERPCPRASSGERARLRVARPARSRPAELGARMRFSSAARLSSSIVRLVPESLVQRDDRRRSGCGTAVLESRVAHHAAQSLLVGKTADRFGEIPVARWSPATRRPSHGSTLNEYRS